MPCKSEAIHRRQHSLSDSQTNCSPRLFTWVAQAWRGAMVDSLLHHRLETSGHWAIAGPDSHHLATKPCAAGLKRQTASPTITAQAHALQVLHGRTNEVRSPKSAFTHHRPSNHCWLGARVGHQLAPHPHHLGAANQATIAEDTSKESCLCHHPTAYLQ